MKMRIDNLVKIFLLILLIAITALYSGNASKPDFDQAKRIAAWKSEYEKLKYCFGLVNLYEGSIIPAEGITEEQLKQRLIPYFNTDGNTKVNFKKYKYTKRNRTKVRKDGPYFFDDFFQTKDSMLLSVKKADMFAVNENTSKFIMFVDINGIEKPNRIGKDIFFINVYADTISPAGFGADRATMKTNCSPVGSGVYCSQYYLLGGRF